MWKMLCSRLNKPHRNLDITSIVKEGEILCSDYIEDRLVRSGLQLRQRSVDEDGVHIITRTLITVGEILETRHPTLYTGVLKQLQIKAVNESGLHQAFSQVSKGIFCNGVTWSKVIALFAFSGALAVDCVLYGVSGYVPLIKKWTATYIAENLASWIKSSGGWDSMVDNFTGAHETEDRWMVLWFAGGIFLAFIVVSLISSINKWLKDDR